MKRKLLGSSAFINSFGVTDPLHKVLNILKLNGGSMSVEELMFENTDPHDITAYTIKDFLNKGLLESKDTNGSFRLQPSQQVRLTAKGLSVLENSA